MTCGGCKYNSTYLLTWELRVDVDDGQLQAPPALPTGKVYLLQRRLGRPQSRSGRGYGEKILLLPGIEPEFLGRPAHSLVAIPSNQLRFQIENLC
jgi:hypothetical protein